MSTELRSTPRLYLREEAQNEMEAESCDTESSSQAYRLMNMVHVSALQNMMKGSGAILYNFVPRKFVRI
jgi:hypothetical protein